MENENRQENDTKDIRRLRVRSSRPTPPPEMAEGPQEAEGMVEPGGEGPGEPEIH